MTRLTKINVAVLFSSDLKRSAEFYRDTLGMPVQFDAGNSTGFDLGGFTLILLDMAGARDLLTEEAVENMRPGSGPSQLVSFVDDVDAAYADLKAKGVQFLREPVDRDWGLRTAHFRDPDGNIWELGQWLKKEEDAPSG